MRNLRKNLNAYNGSRVTKGLDKNITGSASNRQRQGPVHDSPCPSRKKLRKGSTLKNTNAVRKYSPYEPDLMTTTPKLIRKLLSKQFSCTREAAYAYIQSIQAVSLKSLVPSSPAAVSSASTLVPSQILLLGSCCWTGSEATEAKAMLYEIIVSFTLNVGRRGWDNLSLKDFAENAVRNFVFAVQRVVQFIWLEPIRNHQQQQHKFPYQQHTDRCTTTNQQREHLDQQLEQEYFHTFTTLVYQIYALTHESLAFLCSTLQQSVLVPHHSHNPQQQQQQQQLQQRCPLSSQVFTLPAHARPVVGQDGISLLIQRLEQELDIYFGRGEADIYPSTFLATKQNASQRRIYGVIREAIIETNINDKNKSNRTKTFLTTTTTTTTTSVEQQEEEYVFLQIVLGRLHPMEEKEKNCSSLVPNVVASCEDATKKFLVLYQPCSNLCVLATTGRRLPSKLVDITPKLLAALTATICGDTPGRFFHTGGNKEKAVNITAGLIDQMSFQQMSGTYPLSLLQSALHIQRGLASGRFRYFASSILNDVSTVNPLQEIEQVSTSLVIGGTTASESLPKQLCTQLLLPHSSKNPTALIVNHSKLEKDKCFLSQQNELGNIGDCPRRSRVSWKWIGEFDVSSLPRDQAVTSHRPKQQEQQQEYEAMEKPLHSRHTIDFSCGITFEGQNVFQGIQALIAMGYTRSPLPDFIRDAPAVGFDVIEVHHGRLVSSKTNA